MNLVTLSMPPTSLRHFYPQLMDMLITESDTDKRSLISACLSNFRHEHLSPQTYKFIIEQVTSVVMPAKPEPVYQLIFKKKQSQASPSLRLLHHPIMSGSLILCR